MRVCLLALVSPLVFGSTAAQSPAHNYESFFGFDDRIDLYSEAADKRFSKAILKTIRDNTLLMDCGSSGKPSTGFIVKTSLGTQIISAGHNLTMAEAGKRSCKLAGASLTKGKASPLFKDSGTKEDAGYDIASWPNITKRGGLDICKSISTSSKFVLVQSWDGNGKLGISADCKVKALNGRLITTSCKGHYKASGGPLLAVSENSVCAAGVFNAHSGKQFNYESYAARLTP
ncbi:MAG: hypothetical protein ABJN69_15200 [Hellea sp.]